MPPFPPAGHVHERISTGTVKIVRQFAAILQQLQRLKMTLPDDDAIAVAFAAPA